MSLVGLLLCGCASDRPALQVHRAYSNDRFTATFDRAYFSQSMDGQMDVILLSDGAGQASVDQPLPTQAEQSVRQVVHVRVLWQKPGGLRLDNPSATNAMIDWHVIASPHDRLTYSGSCWAYADVDGDQAELDIRNATLSIAQVEGAMDDPLKRASVSGQITLKRADATVKSYLTELSALRPQQRVTLPGPPARGVSTP